MSIFRRTETEVFTEVYKNTIQECLIRERQLKSQLPTEELYERHATMWTRFKLNYKYNRLTGFGAYIRGSIISVASIIGFLMLNDWTSTIKDTGVYDLSGMPIQTGTSIVRTLENAIDYFIASVGLPSLEQAKGSGNFSTFGFFFFWGSLFFVTYVSFKISTKIRSAHFRYKFRKLLPSMRNAEETKETFSEFVYEYLRCSKYAGKEQSNIIADTSIEIVEKVKSILGSMKISPEECDDNHCKNNGK